MVQAVCEMTSETDLTHGVEIYYILFANLSTALKNGPLNFTYLTQRGWNTLHQVPSYKLISHIKLKCHLQIMVIIENELVWS